jgi:hypothetical protein
MHDHGVATTESGRDLTGVVRVTATLRQQGDAMPRVEVRHTWPRQRCVGGVKGSPDLLTPLAGTPNECGCFSHVGAAESIRAKDAKKSRINGGKAASRIAPGLASDHASGMTARMRSGWKPKKVAMTSSGDTEPMGAARGAK